ncbi:hypothetical protein Salat_1632500 [Sesamum alatum]|uniref:GRF-type domain-containing protein n=1 Tax=Sesamum alatum TaxID=300844 RepID=A0AAE1Y614_9LAMI|nr:hypothetical protein Salat_1632500 [Sesamum alatum]
MAVDMIVTRFLCLALTVVDARSMTLGSAHAGLACSVGLSWLVPIAKKLWGNCFRPSPFPVNKKVLVVLVIMNRLANNESQSHSTAESCTNTMGSDGSNVVRTCLCGVEVVVRTSWTNPNHGHRFRSCPGDGGYDGVFEWIDPPMCRRSKEVISSLLNRINNQDKLLKEYRQKLHVSEGREGKMMMYRLSWIVASIITLVLLIFYVRATIISMSGDGFLWQQNFLLRALDTINQRYVRPVASCPSSQRDIPSRTNQLPCRVMRIVRYKC